MAEEVKCSRGYAGTECRMSTKEGGKCHCACGGENHGVDAPKSATGVAAPVKSKSQEKREKIQKEAK